MAKYKLTNAALHTIRGLLNKPGWAETPSDIYLGGKIVCSVPDLEFRPEEGEKPQQAQKRLKELLEQVQEVQFSREELATIEKAIKALLATKEFGASKEFAEVISVLEIV